MLKHTCVAAALALAAGAAPAQSRPGPDDPRAAAPPPAHASAYEGYRPFREEEMAPWREVNDEVGRLGGHSGHMKAATPPPAEHRPAPSAPQPEPRAGATGGSKHAH